METEKKEKEIKFLKGKRLYLRPPLRADIPHFLRWINDEDVTQYLAVNFPVMWAEEEQWFENLQKRKETVLVLVIVTNEGVPIGTMGLQNIKWVDRVATTGAMIGEKEFLGRGYGTEAKMLLLNYAFNILNLRKICSEVLAYNRRSYAYQIKCGYKEEGIRRRQYYKKGRYWDAILMAVFKKDWLPIWKKYKKENLK